MRTVGTVLGLVGMVLGAGVGMAAADERADWGTAVSVGADSGSHTLLLKNDRSFSLIAVDPFATVQGAGLRQMTFSDIRPGDRIDYAVATWAGMDVAEVLHVTPLRHADAGR